jgi:hypothetical protein
MGLHDLLQGKLYFYLLRNRLFPEVKWTAPEVDYSTLTWVDVRNALTYTFTVHSIL